MTFNAATALFRGIACTLALVVAVALEGCTGGTVILAEGGIVGTGATALSVSGTIASFGADSITVNGRTLSTSKAVVRIDDAPGSVADLRVGMVVDIAATVEASGAAAAGTIVYRAAARGVADGLDRNAKTFTLLGQTVQTDGNTVFDGGTFDTVVSQFVEVSGFRAAAGDLLATRVQISATAPPGMPADVVGLVAALNTATRTFALGALVVDYRSVPLVNVPAQLANGVLVEVRGMQTTGSTTLAAQSLQILTPGVAAAEGAQVDVEGAITDFAGPGSFKVNGQAVDARAATIVNGTTATLGDGARVEAEGRVVGGVVVATVVRIESVPTLEIDGIVATVSATTGTFTIGAQVFATTPSTQYEDRSAAHDRTLALASLNAGDRVAVTATTLPALVATRIVRLDATAPPPSAPDTTYEGTISDFYGVSDFKVGGNRVNAASATFVNGVAATLANGRRVAAVGKLSSGVLLASLVTFEDVNTTPPPSTTLKVEGTISGFVSLSSFVVAGQAVNAASASVSGGSASTLANGVRVEVEGTLAGGVLLAQTVEIESTPNAPSAEAEGAITSFISISSFVIAGQRIDATRATFTHGSAQDLAVGRAARVKGTLVGGVLVAATVDVDDPQEVDVEGAISNYASVASFVVAGRQVDASAAAFEEGTAAKLANGVRVGVKGTLAGAVLKATRVQFK